MIREGLTFDDVLLTPNYSEIESRSDIDLSVKLPKGVVLSNPIVPANMATICEKEMAKCIANMGGLAIIHRFMTIENQIDLVSDFKILTKKGGVDYLRHIGFSIGVKNEDYGNVHDLIMYGARIICIDVAHGDSKMCVDMCRFINEKYPEVLLVAGNVATGSGARRLWEAGADVVKVGVGSGGICSTRLQTGNGVPQLTALMDVTETQRQLRELESTKYYPNEKDCQRTFPIISDGGCNKAADICKSLCFSDLTMIGGLLAGTDECPTEKIEKNEKWYKRYDGSSTYKGTRVEGIKSLVPYKGPVQKILNDLLDGLQSCCSYQGVDNLIDLKKEPQFIKITNSGIRESGIHDVIPLE